MVTVVVVVVNRDASFIRTSPTCILTHDVCFDAGDHCRKKKLKKAIDDAIARGEDPSQAAKSLASKEEEEGQGDGGEAGDGFGIGFAPLGEKKTKTYEELFDLEAERSGWSFVHLSLSS